MSIRVPCPNCGNVLNAPDAAAGKRGKCPKCGTSVTIPAAPPPPPRVVKATPITPPKPAPDEAYDIEIEDDPPPKPVRKAESFDVEVEDETQAPPPPAPVNTNPFAFAPPPDSAAAKLNPFEVGDTGQDPSRPPLHPGWRAVADGLGALKRSVQINFIVALLAALVVAVATSGSGAQAVGWIGLLVLVGATVVFSLIALLFLVLGLIKCLKMPEYADGGGGRQLALYALIATGASVLCGLAGVAVPFLLGGYLRMIGLTLPSPPTMQAANRFMIAMGVAILVSILAPIANIAITAATLSSGSVDTAILLTVLVTAFTLVVSMVALILFLVALSTAETAIQAQIRVRGLRQPSQLRDRRDDDDEEDERPAKRPPKKAAPDDDYNPFA